MHDTSEIRKNILNMIKTLFDPEIPVNVWDLGLIYGVDVDSEGIVLIIMTLTSPNCPVIDILPEQVREVASSVPGVEEVEVEIVWDPPWNKEMMSDEAKLELGMLS